MSVQVLIGLIVMATGVVFVLIAAKNNGEAHEYLYGVFFGEWGAMFVVNGLLPSGAPRVGASLFFAIAMGSTAYLSWRLRRSSIRRPPQDPPARS